MELADIKGIGPKRIELLRQLGIESLSDLLAYYPSSYLDFSTCTPVEELEDGMMASVRVTLTSGPSWYSRKGLTTVTVYGRDPAGKRLALRYFNQPYRGKGLEPGQTYIASGRVHMGEKGAPALLNPLLARELRGIVPVYDTLKGLTQTNLRDGIRAALEGAVVEETLPPALREKRDLPGRQEALWALHFPTDRQKLDAARRRRAYEDALYYFLASQELKAERKRRNGIAFSAQEALKEYLKMLPFEPTHAQQRVLFEVARDMSLPVPMNRMIEGDVGSGKTSIALFALYAAARDGRQGALLAPTEILARQHYEALKGLFGDRCGLLLGSETARERREALQKLESGAWQAVTGTHALFSESVRFHNLGVVICDEQHRFGVAQRSAMEQKGARPDVLVMSATPIPRTLALILYGDLDLSVIDELPAGRKPIKTHLVGPAKRKDMYRYLAARAREGEQSYVVCPLWGTCPSQSSTAACPRRRSRPSWPGSTPAKSPSSSPPRSSRWGSTCPRPPIWSSRGRSASACPPCTSFGAGWAGGRSRPTAIWWSTSRRKPPWKGSRPCWTPTMGSRSRKGTWSFGAPGT